VYLKLKNQDSLIEICLDHRQFPAIHPVKYTNKSANRLPKTKKQAENRPPAIVAYLTLGIFNANHHVEH